MEIIKIKKLVLTIIFFFLFCKNSLDIFAATNNNFNHDIWEANISAYTKGDPEFDRNGHIYGARFSATYFFSNYKNFISFGLDNSINHAQTSKKKYKANFSDEIWIVSSGILIRFYYDVYNILASNKFNKLQIFLEGGIGPSYMSNKNFEGKRLGSQFAFQDISGAGIKLNYNNNEILSGLYIIHYSNAGLSSENRGITLPILLRLGYRF